MKFRTKPFEIDAVQFTGNNWDEVNAFAQTSSTDEVYAGFTRIAEDDAEFSAAVYDFLHDTWVNVKKGQWIIKGAKGEHYPCDPEIFAAKYEATDG